MQERGEEQGQVGGVQGTRWCTKWKGGERHSQILGTPLERKDLPLFPQTCSLY